jgi:hypothetical protein
MSRRVVGLLLALAVIAAVGGLIQDYRLDGRIAAERSAVEKIDSDRVAALGGTLLPERDVLSPDTPTAREVHQAQIARLGTWRFLVNLLAMLIVAGVAVYLGWGMLGPPSLVAPTTAQMFRELPPPVKSTGTPPTGLAAPTVTAPAVRSPHLAATAELCVDLAKVMHAEEVPALLERTATILDAKGVVLWAADETGVLLTPSAAHGFSEKVMKSLRSVQVNADNVTSLAFRSLQPQALNGASVNDPAAIAIPLLTASGCVGVMSAELRHNRPPADLLPLAKIIGAQFSALIVPAPAMPAATRAST